MFDYGKNLKCFKRRVENLISLFFTCLHRGRSSICVSCATCFYIFSCAKKITLPSKHVQIKIKVVLLGTIYVRDLCQICLHYPQNILCRSFIWNMTALSQSIMYLYPKYIIVILRSSYSMYIKLYTIIKVIRY